MNAPSKTKIILASVDGAAKDAYVKILQNFDVQLDVVSSLNDLFKMIQTTPYNGMLIDLITKLKASRRENIIIDEILKQFPVVQLKYDRQTGNIRTLSLNQLKRSKTIDGFVLDDCRKFPARTARLKPRRKINFNVILSTDRQFAKPHLERSVTLDVSDTGCFVISSGNHWKLEHRVWVIFKELKNKAPMTCVIKRVIPWGEAIQIPGIGLTFKKIDSDQSAELETLKPAVKKEFYE